MTTFTSERKRKPMKKTVKKLSEKAKEEIWQDYLKNPNQTQREMSKKFDCSLWMVNEVLTTNLKKRLNKEPKSEEENE